ncbi:MAG: tRNA uridine(34) 5-carboxymethylaminomethyl modification radical SAM/GNAT enzyme Elp3 [Deltaproteobacteria bacterium]|nr:MAG: tRNA uridine(34) 5-carboxymethylaminomethyl modification radical SAM/GNAT enzyme Elp3 [Deltaproteobacteria bacterium]
MSETYPRRFAGASRRRWIGADGVVSALGFDPDRHAAQLLAILDEIERCASLDARALDRILKRHPKDGRGLFSKAELIHGYRHFRAGEARAEAQQAFVDRLAMRPVRTQSGVAPVTVLTRPHPCPGTCIFCPSDVRMPKSYLPDEPGAQRAADNHFDPYLQTFHRLAAFRAIGHRTDKVELLILGGTWSYYPEPYRLWFVRRCFEALNDFGAGVDGRPAAVPSGPGFEARADGAAAAGRYNALVSARLARSRGGRRFDAAERGSAGELAAVQRVNETSGCRCVGLVVETRPDAIGEAEVLRLRRIGATKVQIGYQSLSDAVLAANRRGHDVAATRRAMRLLRAAGFKVLAHWMPNLLGSDPERDVLDFARIFDDPDFRPDELKIYPCSLVESAELMDPYRHGEWRPYTRAELLHVVSECLRRTPPYCRLSRVIRDIPSTDIVDGNQNTNFREIAEAHLRDTGARCRDIRSREIRGARVEASALALASLEYETSTSREVFLEFTAPGDRLAAFLRLSLPKPPSFVDEIAHSALIREVHVYGLARGLGEGANGRAQHAGLGRRLVEAARRRAAAAGYADLAVISAVGTRAYYRAIGFADGALYQHRPTGGAARD